MIFINLGEDIKKARIERNISRAELSRLSGVPLRTLEEWESGRRNATHIKVINICEILDIDIHNYI